jgi:outer membrane lipoprotein-sorting protein
MAQQGSRVKTVRKTGWLAAAVSAGVAALVVLLLPLNPTPVFAAVQQHFRDFQTMRFVIDQRVGGEKTIQTRVQATRSGNVRTEVGEDVVVIVNSTEGRVLTLIRGSHMAMVSPLAHPVEEEDALKWMKDIREFQGAAKMLPEPRMIQGKKAYGWQLETQGIDMVLWATAEGLPLQMTMNPAAQLQLDFNFEFDVPIAAGTFSTAVPAGYKIKEQK